jgi:TctA family transporter
MSAGMLETGSRRRGSSTRENKSEPASTDPALNSTGASQAVALALMALLPGISAARLASNHNRTRLRD